MCPPANLDDIPCSIDPSGRGSETVRVKLLGTFTISVGSRIISQDEWRLKKAANLIKLLALAPGHSLHREQLMEALWPELGTNAASNNLRRVLHSARKTLDPAVGSRYLASEEGSLALCPAGALWVDVEAFEEAAATARREGEPAAYRAALELYAGELLPADRYEEWTEDRRQELRRLNLVLLVELADIYEERGEYGAAIEALSDGHGRGACARGSARRPDAPVRALGKSRRGFEAVRTPRRSALQGARGGPERFEPRPARGDPLGHLSGEGERSGYPDRRFRELRQTQSAST